MYEPGAAAEAVEQGLALGLATRTQQRRWNRGVEEEEEQTIEMNSTNRGLFSSGSDYDSSSCPCLGSILLCSFLWLGLPEVRREKEYKDGGWFPLPAVATTATAWQFSLLAPEVPLQKRSI